MAKLAVLTDRQPDDTDWKGAFIWRLILSLAESQHEVLVLTTQDPMEIPITHPLLTIAQPAESWRLDKLPKWAQALIQFRPEIIHTFALQPQRTWSQLTIWPYLHSALTAFPQVRRFSTLFDLEDMDSRDSSWIWHQGSQSLSVFSTEHKKEARSVFASSIEVAPLELEIPDHFFVKEDQNYLLIPAPVSEWVAPNEDLTLLARELEREPELRAKIVGGWGDCLASERRRGWEILSAVAGQVQMLDPVPFPGLVQLTAQATALWLRTLAPHSWRANLTRQVAESLGKKVYGPQQERLMGSTANFISRLYTLPG